MHLYIHSFNRLRFSAPFSFNHFGGQVGNPIAQKMHLRLAIFPCPEISWRVARSFDRGNPISISAIALLGFPINTLDCLESSIVLHSLVCCRWYQSCIGRLIGCSQKVNSPIKIFHEATKGTIEYDGSTSKSFKGASWHQLFSASSLPFSSKMRLERYHQKGFLFNPF